MEGRGKGGGKTGGPVLKRNRDDGAASCNEVGTVARAIALSVV